MMTAEPQGKPTAKEQDKPGYFVRFTVGQRIEHAILMVTFIVLSVTGLAQRFYTAGWAEWVILNLGGITYTRFVHRAFGLLFTLSAVYHIVYLLYSLFVRHAKPSMVPTLNDFRDAVNEIRYSFGFAGKPPRFGRFDYRQKFEYWGLLFGSIVIITTGFFLAFPITVTRVLPGQIIAASVAFHGYEATLAVLTIVIWHLYDVILKPAIFPADTSIFTGKISRKRMIEEHPLEYEELAVAQDNSEPSVLPREEPAPDSSTG